MISKQQFWEYYHQYSDKIYNYLYYKSTWDEQLAYDLTSQVWMKALKNLTSYDENKSQFKTWIYTIAHNTYIDFFKSQRWEENIDQMENLLFYYEQIEEKIDTKQKLKGVYDHLNSLSHTTKQIIILRAFEELSFDEISHIAWLSTGACKMQYKRWIEHIRWSMELVLLILILL